MKKQSLGEFCAQLQRIGCSLEPAKVERIVEGPGHVITLLDDIFKLINDGRVNRSFGGFGDMEIASKVSSLDIVRYFV